MPDNTITFARSYNGVGGGEITVNLVPPGYVEVQAWRGGLGVKVTLDANDVASVVELLQRTVQR